MTKPIKQIKPLSGKQADAFAKAMMLKEAVASCSLDGETQCGTIEPEKELTHITSKCKGETWEEADARNNYFIEQGKAQQRKEDEKEFKKFINELKEYHKEKIEIANMMDALTNEEKSIKIMCIIDEILALYQFSQKYLKAESKEKK